MTTTTQPVTAQAPTRARQTPEPPVAPPARRTRRRWPVHLGFLGILVFGWWAITAVFSLNPLVLPGPQLVIQELIDASRCVPLGEGSARFSCGEQGYFLWQHLLATVQRVLVGLGVGIVLGIALGWLLASLPKARTLLEPYITFIRALPPMGYIGLLIVWFGIGDGSKIILLILATFPIVTVGTLSGFLGVRQDWLRAAHTLGAGSWQIFRTIRVPGALPEIMSSIRLASSTAWASIVAAEINDGIPGIGGLAYLSGTSLNTALAIGSIIVIGLVALAFDQFIVYLSKKGSPWRGK